MGMNGGSITNCDFRSNNGHSSYGSLIRFEDDASTEIINSTFISNSDNIFGGVNWNLSNASPDLYGCIIWNNSVINDSYSNFDLDISYSCVNDGWPGSGNINQDPLICNPYSWEPLSLSSESPCVQNGWENANMGDLPIECLDVNRTLYVDINGDNFGSGALNNPINNLQIGYNSLYVNDTVVLASGEYELDYVLSIKPATLIGEDSSNTSIIFDGEGSGQAIFNNNDYWYNEDYQYTFKNIKIDVSSANTANTGMNLYRGNYEFEKLYLFKLHWI